MTDDLPTTRIPRVEDRTQPIPPINNHDHGRPVAVEARDPLFWRALASAAALTVLVATGLAWKTDSLWWLLLVWPGAPVVALAVVGGAVLAGRGRP